MSIWKCSESTWRRGCDGLNTSLESLVEKLSDIEVRLNGKGDKAEFGKLAGDISILRQEIEKEKISKVG
jgi:hypothetical protein